MPEGRQRTAARALAGLGVQDLAASGEIAPRYSRRLETGGVIHILEMERHDHVQRAVWGSDHGAALAEAGVELLAEGGSFGAVCWKKPGPMPRDEPGKGRRRILGTRRATISMFALDPTGQAGCGGSSWCCGRDLFILWGNVLVRRLV